MHFGAITLFGWISAATAIALPSYSNNIAKRQVAPTRIIHQFPDLTWVENIRIRQNGQFIVTLATAPEAYIIDPNIVSTNATSTSGVNLLHSFMPYNALLGITEVHPDQFFVVAGNFSVAIGDVGTGTYSIWSLDLRKYNPSSNTGIATKLISPFPNAGLLNGIDTLDASKNLIVIADSTKGYIWLLNVETGENRILLDLPELKPAPGSKISLGVNGLKVLHQGEIAYIYFSNDALSILARVPISLSTITQSGPVQILNNGTAIDDFALDPKNGVMYLAGQSTNTVLKLPLTGGSYETMANATSVLGPTDAAIGRTREQEGKVYVTTSGLLRTGGKVVEVDVGC
ncbi:hypothetical protein BGZ60DRAFT_397090 [Tricladium varicosporioides]|nr:hypothetical protein BGZ60DRAFT_397090 [Hymenoscyphus varicosporioides]